MSSSPMTDAPDVAVIGLGAMGAAALYQLARRGIPAIGLDRHAPPHPHGSTHGETRITRQAVGEGMDYVPLVLRSHVIWRALELATGRRLFEPCGGLFIGKLGDAPGPRGTPSFLRATVEVARACGIAHDLLDRFALATRFPQFIGLDPDDVAYHEPGAGFVRPEACIEAQLGEAVRLGARIRTGVEVRELRRHGDMLHVETDIGPIRVARAIVAAGAWTAGLLGAPFDRLLRVTRQRLYWFRAEVPALYAPERCPVFLRQHGDSEADFYYGFPTPEGSEGVKVADERDDDPVDPLRYAASDAADGAAAFHAAHVAGRLEGVTATALKSVTCLYTRTADGRFLIDDHPALPGVTIVSACSGHGFKHSAAIGELVAEHVRGGPLPAAFGLGGALR